MSDEWQTVYTMTDYYDGPRGGIANFDGRPHVYESLFDENEDEFSDTFRLWPVDSETLALALESWAIWLRWESAFYDGAATRGTHPALSADRARHEELEVILRTRLDNHSAEYVEATGKFRVREDVSRSGRGWRPLEVIWSIKTSQS